MHGVVIKSVIVIEDIALVKFVHFFDLSAALFIFFCVVFVFVFFYLFLFFVDGWFCIIRLIRIQECIPVNISGAVSWEVAILVDLDTSSGEDCICLAL